MTRSDNRQQNAERRLRHSTWEREPVFPTWAVLFALAIGSTFIASFLGAN